MSSWRTFSNVGGATLWIAGLSSSLFQDGRLGPDHAARTLDGFIVDAALNEGLSAVVREKRPYGNAHDSFPSLHSSLSFEVAAAQSYYHPRQAPIWYGAAALISYSRIPAHEHYWQDVLCGGLLGYGSGQLSVSSRHGWLIAPIFEGRRTGGSFSCSFRF